MLFYYSALKRPLAEEFQKFPSSFNKLLNDHELTIILSIDSAIFLHTWEPKSVGAVDIFHP